MSKSLEDLDTSYAQRHRDAARPQVQVILDRATAKGGPIWNLITKPSAMLQMLIEGIIFTLVVRYLLPLLPGVTLDGTIYDAASTALMMLASAIIIGQLLWMAFIAGLRRMSKGKEPEGLLGFLEWAPLAMAAMSFTLLVYYPGYLKLDGFWAYVYLLLTIGAIGIIYREVKPLVCSN